jgi:hypothetical protein
MKLEAKARLSATVVTAAGLDSLPPRKRAVADKLVEVLSAAGLEPKFHSTFEGTVTFVTNKGVSFLAIAKLLKPSFTFHGASHGTKGFMAYNFSDNGKSPFTVYGWDRDNRVTISQTRTRWTPKNADLPEFSVLALRQNLEALSGVKLKPVIAKKSGAIMLKGIMSTKQNRDEVLAALKSAGKLKTIRVKARVGGMVDRAVLYIPKAEATASVVFVGGPGGGHRELHIS